MEAERKQQLVDLGINVDEMLERFMGNSQMIEKFLKKFLQESHYQKLQEALAQEDVTGAFEEAHALKGVCGNLSLVNLYKCISQQVEYLRCGELEQAKEMMPEVEAEYKKIINGLSELLG
ncbi:MAG: Hpt domain-containing protein [Lachnospiraceae bacterium]|nr:Hpt domain-containing protein [Lachnospiraceae bacterium]